MGAFPTGVTVVTAMGEDGAPLGLTVNSFTSVSLDPPLVLVCIDTGSNSHDRLVASGSFAVNVLAAEHDALARRFASLPADGRFDGLSWAPGPTGAPILAGMAAWLACTVEAVYPGGDHSIVVGRVAEAQSAPAPALLFHRGTLGALDP